MPRFTTNSVWSTSLISPEREVSELVDSIRPFSQETWRHRTDHYWGRGTLLYGFLHFGDRKSAEVHHNVNGAEHVRGDCTVQLSGALCVSSTLPLQVYVRLATPCAAQRQSIWGTPPASRSVCSAPGKFKTVLPPCLDDLLGNTSCWKDVQSSASACAFSPS